MNTDKQNLSKIKANASLKPDSTHTQEMTRPLKHGSLAESSVISSLTTLRLKVKRVKLADTYISQQGYKKWNIKISLEF